MQLHVTGTSIDRPEIFYNPMDSTVQCKFQGYVYEVRWYLHLPYFYHLGIRDRIFQLHWGDQYHQSTIQATNVKNYYVNELTILNGSAHFGLYSCSVPVRVRLGFYYSDSTGISICKLDRQLDNIIISVC